MGTGLLRSMPVGRMPSRALRTEDASQLPSPTNQGSMSSLVYLSPYSSPCSWTDPPSRCGRQRRGSRPFPSFASLMPRTGFLCLSTVGEAWPGLAEVRQEGDTASLPPTAGATAWDTPESQPPLLQQPSPSPPPWEGIPSSWVLFPGSSDPSLMPDPSPFQ